MKAADLVDKSGMRRERLDQAEAGRSHAVLSVTEKPADWRLS